MADKLFSSDLRAMERALNEAGKPAEHLVRVFADLDKHAQQISDSTNELEEQFGEEVIKDFKLLNTDALIPILVSAMKELKADNDQYKTMVNSLTQLVESLTQKGKQRQNEIGQLKALIETIIQANNLDRGNEKVEK